MSRSRRTSVVCAQCCNTAPKNRIPCNAQLCDDRKCYLVYRSMCLEECYLDKTILPNLSTAYNAGCRSKTVCTVNSIFSGGVLKYELGCELKTKRSLHFQTQRTNLTHKATNPEYKYIERDAVSYSVADRIEDNDELRLVLFGTKQSGKSSTGDMIIGEAKFPAQCLTKSNISTNILHRTIRCGKTIKIVETPGFRISELAREDVKVNVVKNINTATQQLGEEPHAYLYIISSKTNLDQETKVIDLIYRRLRKLIDKIVIVFTGFDFLQPKRVVALYVP
ncbi:unnamed protein product [Mytilus edulis]|uniref:AIG1-type G domain-containing protein n=1 Tax=Mytilus edulis TaxID=6550 RepID=A0A8S3SFE3_MYTED|nr:unnamed protein product [Mytilus edulis]